MKPPRRDQRGGRAQRGPERVARGGDARPQRREEEDLDRICGLPAVAALMARAPDRVVRLFLEPAMRAEAAKITAALARVRKPYREVHGDELARIAGTAMHGGLVALAKPKPVDVARVEDLRRWAKAGEPVLVLDGVGNPQNLGAIARTAAFFGVKRLLISDHPGQAAPSDAAYRIAKGGLSYVEVWRAPRLELLLEAVRRDYLTVATALERGVSPETISRDARPVMLVLGNEEDGLPRATIAACETVVRLDGSGDVQSLNVSVTAGILIHALLRD